MALLERELREAPLHILATVTVSCPSTFHDNHFYAIETHYGGSGYFSQLSSPAHVVGLYSLPLTVEGMSIPASPPRACTHGMRYLVRCDQM